jgi:hypothetical protein
MQTLEHLNSLYSTYRAMGMDKASIVRKLKAQFSSAKFTFKGATLFVSFNGNTAQKVTG